MQRDYHRIKAKHEEAIRAAAKYQENLHTCKEVSEVAGPREHSLLAVEMEVKDAQVEKDQAKADMVRASAALTEHEKVLDATVRERNSLRIQVARIGV